MTSKSASALTLFIIAGIGFYLPTHPLYVAGIFLLPVGISLISPKSDLSPHPTLLRWLRVSGLLTLLTFLSGYWVKSAEAALSCPAFPGCGEGAFNGVGAWAQMTHRSLGGLAVLATFKSSVELSKQIPVFQRLARNWIAFSAAQVFLGIGAVSSIAEGGHSVPHQIAGVLHWTLTSWILVRTQALSLPL